MNDPQTMIDSIRAAIEIPESVSTEKLAELASEYAATCKEINQRLEHCSRYLRTGNPCEAVRLAESTPLLLDLCNIIDFPERDDWGNICKSQNLEVAPTIIQSLVESLNAAYDTVYQSEDLLKEHRRLALARAPLKDRLDVLYKLGENEPENVLWTDMIGKFETARLEEITTTFNRAKAEKNAARVVPDLLRELETCPWKTPPPTSLVDKLRSVAKDAAVKQNIQQFRVLADNFHFAVAANDIPRAAHWRDQWNARLKTSHISLASIPEEIRNIFNTAAKWLASIEQKNKIAASFKNKLNELEISLQTEDDPNELREVYQVIETFAQRYQLEIPIETTVAYRAKYNRLTSNKLRLRLLTVIGVVVIAILLFLLIAQGVRIFLGSAQVNATASRVSRLLKSYHEYVPNKPDMLDALEKAEKELDRLKTEMPKSVRYQAVVNLDKALKAARNDDVDRQKRLADAIALAEKQMLPDTNGNVSLDGQAVEDAKRLVRTSDENVRWQKTREKYVDLVNKQNRKEELQLRQDLTQLENRADELEEDELLPEDKVRQAIDAIRKDFRALAAVERKTPFPDDAEDKLETRLKQLETGLTNRQQFKKDLERLVQAVGSRMAYATALQVFENKYPESSFVRDIPKVKAGLSCEANVIAWNLFSAGQQRFWLGFANFATPARQFAADFEGKVSRFSFIPEIGKLGEIVDRLQALIAYGGRQKICEQLDKFFSDQKKNLFVYRHEKDGKVAYHYFISQNNNERSPWRLKSTDIATTDLKAVEIAKLPVAPHQAVFGDSLTRLRPLLSSDYYPTVQWYDVMGRILRDFDPGAKERNMDPYIRLLCLRAVLEMLVVDPLIQKHFTPWLDKLNHAALDRTIDWTDSNSSALSAQRKLCVEIFASFDSLQDRLDAISGDLQTMYEPILANYVWIGFLQKSQNWECICSDRVAGLSGPLFIYRYSEGEPIRFLRIGDLTDGKATVNVSSDILLQGQPVFLRGLRAIQENLTEEI